MKRAWGIISVSSPVLKKEKHDMTSIIKQDVLPHGMALVRAADGKWFPAFATFSFQPHRVHVEDESPALIPPALAPFSDPSQGYDSREEAIEACRAWHEAARLA
jgi:hypothetical protein